MNPKPYIMRLLGWRQRRAFENACRDPRSAQERVWAEVWSEIGDSPYWRSKRSTTNPKLESFPITEYEDYKSAIERSFETDSSELNGKKVLMWCTSSGTSGFRKLFPLTDLMLEQMQRTTKPYSFALAKVRPKSVTGKIIYIPAVRSKERSPKGIEVGFISAYIYRSLPDIVKKSYAFPYELFENGPTYEEWSSLYAVANDCTLLLAITPVTLTVLARNIVKNRARDLAILEGRESWPEGLPPIDVTPDRLETVRLALSKEKLSFRALWPDLDCVTTWKGSTSALQLPELMSLLDDEVLVTDGQYSATEGWMTVPFIDERVGSAFHAGAHVVEFFDAESDVKSAKIVKPWELEVGKDYEVLLSTAMGFVRYRLRDVVTCKGFHHSVPILEFKTKAEGEVSIGQTRFSEVLLTLAMTNSNFHPEGKWIFAPDVKGEGLELVTDRAQDPEAFAKFTKALSDLHPEIEPKTKRGLLKPFVVRVAADLTAWNQPAHGQSKQKVISKIPMT